MSKDKNNKIQELLAVLDLSEEKQVDWAFNEFGYDIHFTDYKGKLDKCRFPLTDTSLADLAFRLRDEVDPCFWYAASYNVAIHSGLIKDSRCKGFSVFGFYESKPIHWIIAALIAKELADKS